MKRILNHKKSVRLLVISLCVILIAFTLVIALIPLSNERSSTGSEANGWFESVPVDIFEEDLAPGRQGTHDVTVKNTSNYQMDYELAFYSSEGYIPLKYRILDDGEYVIGDENHWVNVSTLENSVKSRGSILVGGTLNLTVEWYWPFESGNDALDTQIGSSAAEEKYFVTVFGLDRDSNAAPVVMKSDSVELIGPGITALTIFAACILGKGYYSSYHKNERNKKVEMRHE